MSDPEALAVELQALLPHLYDPNQPTPPQVAEALGLAPEAEVRRAQGALIAAIRGLEPEAAVPAGARIQRLYRVLKLRYLEKQTQEQASHALGITVRHLAREQASAIEYLARYLWRQGQQRGAGQSSEEPPPIGTLGGESPGQHEQLAKELASLKESSSATATDVGNALRQAVGVVAVLAERHNVTLAPAEAAPGTIVEVHASILAQVLVNALTQLLRPMRGGRVESTLSVEEGSASVMLRASPAADLPLCEEWLAQKLVASQGGALSCHLRGGTLELLISLPLARLRTVLVVDDNPDLVHFYRLCVRNTPYEIVSLSEGQHVHEAVEAHRPRVIVLDLMLPDIDGWELLAQLRQQPATRDIPVIILSVIREEELALALGATLCLNKPVSRKAFIAALDQALAAGREVAGEAAG